MLPDHESQGESQSNPPEGQSAMPLQESLEGLSLGDPTQTPERLRRLGYEAVQIPPSGNPEDDPPFVPGVFRKTSARRLAELRIMLFNPEVRAKQGRNIARVIENIEAGIDPTGFYQNGKEINFQNWDPKFALWFEGQLCQNVAQSTTYRGNPSRTTMVIVDMRLNPLVPNLGPPLAQLPTIRTVMVDDSGSTVMTLQAADLQILGINNAYTNLNGFPSMLLTAAGLINRMIIPIQCRLRDRTNNHTIGDWFNELGCINPVNQYGVLLDRLSGIGYRQSFFNTTMPLDSELGPYLVAGPNIHSERVLSTHVGLHKTHIHKRNRWN